MTGGAVGDLVTLHEGDCLAVLPSLPDCSVDAVVTDPPYGLADLKPKVVVEALAAWLGGDRAFVPGGAGFMGRAWDRFVPPPAAWDECYRVLKPGGWLLAFAAPRTADLMGLSVRLAGFSLTDSLHWVTGQGFPKAKSRLKPAHEPIIMARKPAKADSPLPGLDACRVGTDTSRGERYSGKAPGGNGFIDHAMTHGEPWVVTEGRWPPNLLLVHDARCQPAGTRRVRSGVGGEGYSFGKRGVYGDAAGRKEYGRTYNGLDGLETVQAWACADGCPVAGLDGQGGSRPSGGSPSGRSTNTGLRGNTFTRERVPRDADAGGASRFFPQFTWDPEYDLPFMYCAKAPKSERPHVEGVQPHCAIKPLSVMRWLAKLVTRPGGTILDPFAGTGTTGQAAALEGFRAILIEQDPGAVAQARKRLAVPLQPFLT